MGTLQPQWLPQTFPQNRNFFHVGNYGYGNCAYVSLAQVVNDAWAGNMISPSPTGRFYETINELKVELANHIRETYALAHEFPSSDAAKMTELWEQALILENLACKDPRDRLDLTVGGFDKVLINHVGAVARYSRDYERAGSSLTWLIAESCFKVRFLSYRMDLRKPGWYAEVPVSRLQAYNDWQAAHNPLNVVLYTLTTKRHVAALIPKTNDARTKMAVEFSARDDARQANSVSHWKLHSLMYDAGQIRFEGSEQEKYIFASQLLDVDNPRPAFQLATQFLNGTNGCRKNYYEAKRFFELAAKCGHPGADKRLEKLNGLLLKDHLFKRVQYHNDVGAAEKLLEIFKMEKSSEAINKVKGCKRIISHLQSGVIDDHNDPRDPDNINTDPNWATVIQDCEIFESVKSIAKYNKTVDETAGNMRFKDLRATKELCPESDSILSRNVMNLTNCLTNGNSVLQCMGKMLGLVQLSDADQIVSLSKQLQQVETVAQYKAILKLCIKNSGINSSIGENALQLLDAANYVTRATSSYADCIGLEFQKTILVPMEKIIYNLYDTTRHYIVNGQMNMAEAKAVENSDLVNSYNLYCDYNWKQLRFTNATPLSAKQVISEARLQVLNWLLTDSETPKLTIVFDVSSSCINSAPAPVYQKRILPGIVPPQNVKEFALLCQAFLDNPARIKIMLYSSALQLRKKGNILNPADALLKVSSFIRLNNLFPVKLQTPALILRTKLQNLSTCFTKILNGESSNQQIEGLIGALNIIGAERNIPVLKNGASLQTIIRRALDLGIEGLDRLKSINQIGVSTLVSINDAACDVGLRGAKFLIEPTKKPLVQVKYLRSSQGDCNCA